MLCHWYKSFSHRVLLDHFQKAARLCLNCVKIRTLKSEYKQSIYPLQLGYWPNKFYPSRHEPINGLDRIGARAKESPGPSGPGSYGLGTSWAIHRLHLSCGGGSATLHSTWISCGSSYNAHWDLWYRLSKQYYSIWILFMYCNTYVTVASY
jgi:hypothetical protein